MKISTKQIRKIAQKEEVKRTTLLVPTINAFDIPESNEAGPFGVSPCGHERRGKDEIDRKKNWFTNVPTGRPDESDLFIDAWGRAVGYAMDTQANGNKP